MRSTLHADSTPESPKPLTSKTTAVSSSSKAIDNRELVSKRKQDALELAEFIYDTYKEAEATSEIAKNKEYNNAT